MGEMTPILVHQEMQGMQGIWADLLTAEHTPGSQYYGIVKAYNMLLDADRIAAGMEDLMSIIAELNAVTTIDELVNFAQNYDRYFPLLPFFDIATSSDPYLGNSYWAVTLENVALSSFSFERNRGEFAQFVLGEYMNSLLFMGVQEAEPRAMAMMEFIESISLNMSDEADESAAVQILPWNDFKGIVSNSQILLHDDEFAQVLQGLNLFVSPWDSELLRVVDELFVQDNLQTLKDFTKHSIFTNLINDRIFGSEFSMLVEMHDMDANEEEIAMAARFSIQSRLGLIFGSVAMNMKIYYNVTRVMLWCAKDVTQIKC